MDFLKRHLVLAPMAGGVSTPELCAAVSNTGALGNLAGGYLTPEMFRQQLAAVEALTTAPYGVNLFLSGERSDLSEEELDAWQAYRKTLMQNPDFSAFLDKEPKSNNDFYWEKLELVLQSKARVISITFGYPNLETIEQIQQADKWVVLNATTPQEIEYLSKTPVDAIAVQGKEAGGHRATVLSSEEEGARYTTEALLQQALVLTDKPIIAAGGIGTTATALSLIRQGARAVQIGTAFLLAKEAGTKLAHKKALIEMKNRKTQLTRAFSGRLARTIKNQFAEKYSAVAPSLYPEIHYLTAPLRAAANKKGNAEYLNLWAGENFAEAQEGSAAEIVERFTPY